MKDDPHANRGKTGCCYAAGIICLVIAATLFGVGYYVQEYVPYQEMKNVIVQVLFYWPSAFFGLLGLILTCLGIGSKGPKMG